MLSPSSVEVTVMFTYDEKLLRLELDQLSCQACIAFVASCAQRLAHTYHRLAASDAHRDAAKFDSAMDYVWACVLTGSNEHTTADVLEDVMSLLVDEDSSGWTPATGYAEDAVSSLAYSLRYMLYHDAQEAIWAARLVYEAVDGYVIERDDIELNSQDAELRILQNPVVQAELERQARDLNELKAVGNRLSADFLIAMRQRSVKEQAL
jgi:hypothetical protein